MRLPPKVVVPCYLWRRKEIPGILDADEQLNRNDAGSQLMRFVISERKARVTFVGRAFDHSTSSLYEVG
jgi:hypothetical protein